MCIIFMQLNSRVVSTANTSSSMSHMCHLSYVDEWSSQADGSVRRVDAWMYEEEENAHALVLKMWK